MCKFIHSHIVCIYDYDFHARRGDYSAFSCVISNLINAGVLNCDSFYALGYCVAWNG